MWSFSKLDEFVKNLDILLSDVQSVFDVRSFPVIHQGVSRFGRPSWNSPNIDEKKKNGRDGHQPHSRALNGFIYPL